MKLPKSMQLVVDVELGKSVKRVSKKLKSIPKGKRRVRAPKTHTAA